MKNIVVIPAVTPKDKNLDKFGGWNWMDISINAWKFWCKKNDCELVIYDKCENEDLSKHRVTWQRWFDIHSFLENKKIKYNKVAMVDACSIPHWNCPNFFKTFGNKLTVGLEKDNLNWVHQSVEGYKHIFDNFDFDISKYFCTQFVMFNESHKKLFKQIEKFYYDNLDEILELQSTKVRRGTDQTIVNYICQKNNTEIEYWPIPYRLSHIYRKEMFGHNWQLKEDETPFFIKYGHVWFFSGFAKDDRNKYMKDVWKSVKDNYDENYLLNKLTHKDEWVKTTSRRFKEDILRIFKNKKDLTCLELGSCQGDTTRVFAECFKKVYSYEQSLENVEQIKSKCSDINNIEYNCLDIYSNDFKIPDNIDIAFVDAGHDKERIQFDIKRLLAKNKNMILIFDDYGQPDRVIPSAIHESNLNISQYIGEHAGFTCKDGQLTFVTREGVICNMN